MRVAGGDDVRGCTHARTCAHVLARGGSPASAGLLQERFRLALNKHVVVPLVHHAVLSFYNLAVSLGVFLVGLLQVPGDEVVLILEAPYLLRLPRTFCCCFGGNYRPPFW